MFRSIMSKCVKKSKLIDPAHLWSVSFQNPMDSSTNLTRMVRASSRYDAIAIFMAATFAQIRLTANVMMQDGRYSNLYHFIISTLKGMILIQCDGGTEEAKEIFYKHYIQIEQVDLLEQEEEEVNDEVITTNNNNNKRPLSPSFPMNTQEEKEQPQPPPPKAQKLATVFDSAVPPTKTDPRV